jgi:hypothetical protein
VSRRLWQMRQPRESDKRHAAERAFEESDEAIVREKLAKTRVTPVEAMEGRPRPSGQSVARNAPSTQKARPARPRSGNGYGSERKESQRADGPTLSLVTRTAPERGLQGLRKGAATGVDGVTWVRRCRLDERLRDPVDRPTPWPISSAAGETGRDTEGER